MSVLKQRLQDDMKAAMKGGDKDKLGVIRLIMAAIKQREVDERISLEDDQILLVLDKMSKQRRESISQYRGAGREDLATAEEAELVVISGYLPQPFSADEISDLIQAAIAETAAAAPSDMGKVMGVLKPKLQGRADMTAVSAQVKQQLSGV